MCFVLNTTNLTTLIPIKRQSFGVHFSVCRVYANRKLLLKLIVSIINYFGDVPSFENYKKGETETPFRGIILNMFVFQVEQTGFRDGEEWFYISKFLFVV